MHSITIIRNNGWLTDIRLFPFHVYRRLLTIINKLAGEQFWEKYEVKQKLIILCFKFVNKSSIKFFWLPVRNELIYVANDAYNNLKWMIKF